METIIQLIATPLVLLIVSRSVDNIYVKDTKSAIYTSIAILVVGFLVGWFITFIFNLLTLGIFWLIGLGIITRTIAYAVVIELVDKFSKNFDTKGFMPSLVLAIILAVTWGIVDMIF